MRQRVYAREATTLNSGGQDVTVPTVNSSVYERGSQANVASGSETTILAYTVTGSILYLDELDCTGSGVAVFRVYVNTVQKETKRFSGGYAPLEFKYPPLRLEVGDVVAVKVTHYQSGQAYDFEATLKGHR